MFCDGCGDPRPVVFRDRRDRGDVLALCAGCWADDELRTSLLMPVEPPKPRLRLVEAVGC